MSIWIECLGGFALSRDGAPVPLTARKAQVLLGLLACARHRAMPRARLAETLWEHSDEASARVSLRQALAQLRRAAGDGLVDVAGETLRLGAAIGTDVDAMAEALARGDDAAAARFHAGPFLDGALPEGDALRAAVGAERARLAALARGALHRELDRLSGGSEAADAAHRLLALDPLDEAAHRVLIRADLARGARGAARARLEALTAALHRELGVEPAAETRALLAPSRRPAAADPPVPDVPPVPDEPRFLLLALEAEGKVDWTALRTAAEAAGAELVPCGPGECALSWTGRALREVAGTALALAERAGDTLSFGLVAEDGPRPLTSARRVAARAAPGEVHVAAGLARRLGLAADGAGPVVLSSDAMAARPHRPLVGRVLERTQVEAAVEAAHRSGAGVAIHVSGEAGIGKTRLVEEVATRAAARGAHVARIGFEPLGRGARHVAQAVMAGLPDRPGTEPADPTDRALRDWLRLVPPTPEAELRLSALASEARARRLLDLLGTEVTAAAGAEGLLIIVEDAHWAPNGVGDFLLDLADRIGNAPVALLFTERPHAGDLGRRLAARAHVGTVRLVLGPLAREDAAALARDAAPDRTELEDVLERAAGHPLFLLRLLEAGWRGGELPSGIADLVLEQIERLPPDDRTALRHAAILGSAFDPGEVADIFPEAPAPRTHGDLVHATGAGLAFGHDLVRQAIYDEIPAERRAALHGRAADHFEGRDPLRWADQALLAPDDATASRAAAAAANAMISEMRLPAAMHYIEAGLSRGGDAQAVAELHSCRAGIRRMRSDLSGALDDYRDAHAAATSDVTRVAMLVRQALVLHRLGRGAEADRALDAAEGIADRIALAGLGRAEIHEQRGNRAFVAGDYAECLRQHTAGLALAEAARDPRGIARAHGGLGDAHFAASRLRTAYDHFNRAMTSAERAGLGMIHQEFGFMRSYTLFFCEPGARAHLLADLAVESAVEAGAARTEMIARETRAEMRLAALDLTGAREDVDRLAELLRAQPERRFETDLTVLRAWLALREGRSADAFSQLAPHLEAARVESYNGAVFLSLAALAAPTTASRDAILRTGAERIAAGALSCAGLWFHNFTLERLVRDRHFDLVAVQLARLRAGYAEEPLGFANLLARSAELGSSAEAEPGAAARLRAELVDARLDGLALVLNDVG